MNKYKIGIVVFLILVLVSTIFPPIVHTEKVGKVTTKYEYYGFIFQNFYSQKGRGVQFIDESISYNKLFLNYFLSLIVSSIIQVTFLSVSQRKIKVQDKK